MTDQLCPDCGLRRATVFGGFGCAAAFGEPYSYACAVRVRDKQLEELRAKLTATEAKLVEAERDWRALDKLLGLTSEEDGTVVFRVLDDGSRHCQARMVPGRGDDARRALVALASKLVGLLDKAGG